MSYSGNHNSTSQRIDRHSGSSDRSWARDSANRLTRRDRDRHRSTTSTKTSVAKPASTEQQLADAYQKDWELYRPIVEQQLRQLADETTSTAITDEARRSSDRMAAAAPEINQRQLSRAGANLTPAQMMAMDSASSQTRAGNATAVMNTARGAQYDHQMNALNTLIGTTNAMKNNSATSLNSISRNESQRQTAYQNAKANERNQMIGAASSMAALAAMAFM